MSTMILSGVSTLASLNTVGSVGDEAGCTEARKARVVLGTQESSASGERDASEGSDEGAEVSSISIIICEIEG